MTSMFKRKLVRQRSHPCLLLLFQFDCAVAKQQVPDSPGRLPTPALLSTHLYARKIQGA